MAREMIPDPPSWAYMFRFWLDLDKTELINIHTLSDENSLSQSAFTCSKLCVVLVFLLLALNTFHSLF